MQGTSRRNETATFCESLRERSGNHETEGFAAIVNGLKQWQAKLTPNQHGILGLHSQTDLDRLTWGRAEVVVTQV